jgi:membrane associated rhomboid family serine protease
MNVSAALISVFLVLVWLETGLRLREKKRRQPKLPLTVCVVLSLCLLAQLRDSRLLLLFERNTTQVLQGEWWRLVTALFFQDGWIAGGLTNILLLLAIGNLVEQVRRRADWLIIAAAGALTGELLGLRWEPIGAGNSIVTCALAGSLLLVGPFREASVASRLLKSTAIVICLALVMFRDIHGAAAAAGILWVYC